MASLLVGALCALPFAHAHMQMINPSPFRDPHGKYQPMDYDILKPLNADGSNFACKGYHLNTEWHPAATYEPGGTYKMQLQGSATHGGGSCQLSMSFDGGSEFKVIKSMEGGCPESKEYSFTVPKELGNGLKGKSTTGLFAWTWFNKIGNREMYMNCAPVNIVSKGSKHSRDAQPQSLSPRDTAIANAAAQSALSSYPPLFVANLASVNDCVTKETQDVIFDSPGNSVQYADGKSGGGKPSFGKGKCTGRGSKNAGSSSPSSSSPPPPSSPGGSSPGDNGQWKDPSSSKSSSKSGQCNDGQWHPECLPGGNGQKALSGSSSSSDGNDKPAKLSKGQDSVEDIKTGEQPSGDVEKELQDYLSTLYGSSDHSKRTDCGSAKRSLQTCAFPNRWVKRSLCLWVCVRKGRSVKRDTSDLKITLDIQLATLATKIAELFKLVSEKQSLERRDPYIPGAALEQAAPQPTTFDLFLTYLSQLQSTVIECIRGLAAAAPVDRMENAQIIPAEPEIPTEPLPESTPTLPSPDAALNELNVPLPTPAGAELLRGPSQGLSPPVPSAVLDPAFAAAGPVLASGTVEGMKTRRQLLIPDISMLSWLNSIDPSDLSPDTDFEGLIRGMQGLGKNIISIVDALKVEDGWREIPKPPIRHGPPVGVLVPLVNGTSPFNETNNPLQQVADAVGFDPATVTDDNSDSPFNETNNPLQQVADRVGFDPANVKDGNSPFNETNNSLQQAADAVGFDPATVTDDDSPFNETNNPLQQAADAVGFDAALIADKIQNTPPSPSSSSKTPSPSSTTAPIVPFLPYLMGPGPVVPPGVVIDWPGPNKFDDGKDNGEVSNLERFPIVVNDIDDEDAAKEEVRKFFEELGEGAKKAGSKDDD